MPELVTSPFTVAFVMLMQSTALVLLTGPLVPVTLRAQAAARSGTAPAMSTPAKIVVSDDNVPTRSAVRARTPSWGTPSQRVSDGRE